jgi:putative ABC transport system permease protein
MRNGMTLTVIGVAVGLAGAIASARALESMLFGIAPFDAWTFASVAIGFTLVAALASFFPARRATKVEPVVALRCE